MIFIRADMNESIASGHVMRCLSIAAAFRRLGEKCIFLSSDKIPVNIINENGFECIVLNSHWDSLDNELVNLIEILSAHSFPMLIIDSYYASNHYLSTLRNYAYTIIIDDFGKNDLPVSCIVNYNIYSDIVKSATADSDTEFVLGTQYIPLREQFHESVPIEINNRVKCILFCTGASDFYGITDGFLKAINNTDLFDDYVFNVLLGKFNPTSFKTHKKNVVFHSGITDMYNFLKTNDVAISASGSMLYELCACGIPTICFSFADNQIAGSNCFSDKGIMINIGDYRGNDDLFFFDMIKQLNVLINNYNMRKSMSEKAVLAVRTDGAIKLAETLLKKYEQKRGC